MTCEQQPDHDRGVRVFVTAASAVVVVTWLKHERSSARDHEQARDHGVEEEVLESEGEAAVAPQCARQPVT